MSWVVMTGFLVPLVLGCCLVSAEDRDRINETRADKERIFYLSAIFEKYSNNGEISLANVKKLMVNLGLPPATDKMAFDIEGEEKENDTHCHDIGMGCKLLPSDPESSNKMLTKRSLSADHGHFHHNKCLSTVELLKIYHFQAKKTIGKEEFMNLCPSLIVLLDQEECKKNTTVSTDHEEMVKEDHRSLGSIPVNVWGYSSLAIFIISLVGLLGVAVIPIMQRVFYNHLLQFLVALAVGALSGDALLHLIPHALASEDNHAHDSPTPDGKPTEEQKNVFKGLTALIGIFIFFFIERVMTIVTNIKRKRREAEHYRHQLELAAKLGEDEIEQIKRAHELAHVYNHDHDCESLNWGIHPGNRALEHYAEEATRELHEDELLMKKIEEKKKLERKESKSKQNRKLSRSHSHSHSHDGGVPKDVAAVAWMVILGDGIHNFCDGLAIGSAFASSITGGVSTTIAVFCHELPHEIGDFAVLLKAGMKPKQAIVYNVVSSVLAFCGMLVGVLIGNIESASLWIFTVVGGMFLYVALVDMLPEMMAVDAKNNENPFFHLLFQACGMSLGIGIMLLIALYEENMKTMMES
ncbi:zinc transporter ZIP10-like [Ostrea edulis]|uniref:zinc transporter ZIP10-like n=1 Tax=Ostrea edulis TaxID=37623 RepID=UPI0024AEE0A2|nr:zinc transporter ZIP10-like [Ostrea edulis]XP_055996706.1 zinc transporter ZIP10-like [Ostrea edulis]